MFVDRALHWWVLSEQRGTCEHPRVNVCGLLNTARHLDAIQTYYANLTVGSSYIHSYLIQVACHVLSSPITTYEWCENDTLLMITPELSQIHVHQRLCVYRLNPLHAIPYFHILHCVLSNLATQHLTKLNRRRVNFNLIIRTPGLLIFMTLKVDVNVIWR